MTGGGMTEKTTPLEVRAGADSVSLVFPLSGREVGVWFSPASALLLAECLVEAAGRARALALAPSAPETLQ
jgi:hypothetical protein